MIEVPHRGATVCYVFARLYAVIVIPLDLWFGRLPPPSGSLLPFVFTPPSSLGGRRRSSVRANNLASTTVSCVTSGFVHRFARSSSIRGDSAFWTSGIKVKH